MKKILPVFLILIATECHSQIIRFDRKTPQNQQTFLLKGKVKSTTECNYKEIVPGQSFEPLTVHKFDSVGNCFDQSLVGKGGSFLEHITYQFDKNGNYTEFKYYSADGRYSRTVYKYDTWGNEIENTSYDKNGRLEYTSQYTYDKHNNYTSWSIKGENTAREICIYVYDNHNRIVSLKRVYPDSPAEMEQWKYYNDTIESLSKWASVQWVYNMKQQVISRKSIGKEDVHTTKYDAEGNAIEIRQHSDGKLDKFPYSKRYEYVYDKKGNWIKKTALTIEGKAMSSVERKIEYY